MSHKCGTCGNTFNKAAQAKCGRPACPSKTAVKVMATTAAHWGMPGTVTGRWTASDDLRSNVPKGAACVGA